MSSRRPSSSTTRNASFALGTLGVFGVLGVLGISEPLAALGPFATSGPLAALGVLGVLGISEPLAALGPLAALKTPASNARLKCPSTREIAPSDMCHPSFAFSLWLSSSSLPAATATSRRNANKTPSRPGNNVLTMPSFSKPFLSAGRDGAWVQSIVSTSAQDMPPEIVTRPSSSGRRQIPGATTPKGTTPKDAISSHTSQSQRVLPVWMSPFKTNSMSSSFSSEAALAGPRFRRASSLQGLTFVEPCPRRASSLQGFVLAGLCPYRTSFSWEPYDLSARAHER